MSAVALSIALFLTAAALLANTLVIVSVVAELVEGRPVFDVLNIRRPKLAGLASAFFWASLLYGIWIHNDQYKIFCATYAKEEARHKKLRTGILVVFVAISWLSVFVVPIWLRSARTN